MDEAITKIAETLQAIREGEISSEAGLYRIIDAAEDATEPRLPDGVSINHDGTAALVLLYPVTILRSGVEETLTELTIRRQTMGDKMAVKAVKTDLDAAFIQLCRLTGLMDKQVERLDTVDVNRISQVIAVFTTPGRATGSSAAAS